MDHNAHRDYVTWRQQTIPVIAIWRYLHQQQRRPQVVPLAPLLSQDVLHHWSAGVLPLPTGECFYRGLSLQELVNIYQQLQTIDTSVPIFLWEQQVLDGMHRVAAAALRQEQTIKAYLLTTYDLQQLLQQTTTF